MIETSNPSLDAVDTFDHVLVVSSRFFGSATWLLSATHKPIFHWLRKTFFPRSDKIEEKIEEPIQI